MSSVIRLWRNLSLPQDFFEQYVQARKPTVVSGHLTDLEWKGALWSNDYLRQKSGDCDLQMERRQLGETYGRGSSKLTILDSVESSDELFDLV